MPNKPKLVFITSRFPFPLEKGDKLRAYYFIKGLSNSFNITLIAFSDEAVKEEWVAELRLFTSDIHVFRLRRIGIFTRLIWNLFSSQPFQIAYFTNLFFKRKVRAILNKVEPDHIFCQMIRPAEYVKHYHKCPKTIDYMDVLSTGMARRASQRQFFVHHLYSIEHQRLLDYEQRIFNYFEYHLIISQQDANCFSYSLRNHFQIVPNGINTSYFMPQHEITPTFDLVFVGNLSYAPNIDAIKWMCENILKHRKDLKLLIAGADLGKGLTMYISNFTNVTLLGWQDDIRSIYAQGKIFLAPMQIGTGLQNKILEAMAMGKPCITTSLAAAAIPGSPLVIAHTAQEFLAHIDNVLEDPDRANRLGNEGVRFTQDNYSWEKWIAELVSIIRPH